MGWPIPSHTPEQFPSNRLKFFVLVAHRLRGELRESSQDATSLDNVCRWNASRMYRVPLSLAMDGGLLPARPPGNKSRSDGSAEMRVMSKSEIRNSKPETNPNEQISKQISASSGFEFRSF